MTKPIKQSKRERCKCICHCDTEPDYDYESCIHCQPPKQEPVKEEWEGKVIPYKIPNELYSKEQVNAILMEQRIAERKELIAKVEELDTYHMNFYKLIEKDDVLSLIREEGGKE